MKKIQNKQGFAIVLAMGITIVIGLISILILDYIVPFSRNIKGVENSSNAYYNAYAGVEESLWFLSQAPLSDSGSIFPLTATGTEFTLKSQTPIIPPIGDGNSEYSKNWNRLDQNTPIQLLLKTPLIDFIGTATFIFRIPDIDGDNNYTNNGTLSGSISKPMINWILSGLEGTNPVALNASGSYIKKEDINNIVTLKIGNYNGLSLDGQGCSFQNFYTQNCSGSGITSNHTLKLSLIDNLQLTDGRTIPYLEYKINFGVAVPGRYSQIDTAGKSYGYKKTMDIKVPQLSTNQAFDFAVFQ